MGRFPLAIGANKERSDGNQELDCRWKSGLLCSATCGQKLAMSASSDALEAFITAFAFGDGGYDAASPSTLVKKKILANG